MTGETRNGLIVVALLFLTPILAGILAVVVAGVIQ